MLFKETKMILKRHKKALFQLGAEGISIFGSIAREDATKKSDVDILVDFDSKRGLFGFIDLKNYLEKILERDVDLVTRNALHPALKQRILEEAKHVF